MPPQLPKGGSARTGPLPLHPMTLGDILDGAFKLLKANARTILLVTAILYLPIAIISVAGTRDILSVGFINLLNDPSVAESQLEGSQDASQVILQLIAAFGSILVTPFIAGAVAHTVGQSYLGREATVGEALRSTGRKFWPLLGSFILVHLAEAPGLIVCCVGQFFIMAMFVMVAPAVVVEDLGPVAAMRRSWNLTKNRYWQVLGISMLAGVIAYMLSNILGQVPTLAAFLVGGPFALVLAFVGTMAAAIVSAPIVTIVATLLYFDARIRKEAFDLQVMARDLNANYPNASSDLIS